MRDSYTIIEGSYLRDILAQPQAVVDTVAGLADASGLRSLADGLASRRFERLVLTGMGSSFWALYPLHVALLARGYTSLLIETSELIHFAPDLLDARTAAVAVSQSGRSIEMVRMLDRRRAGGFLLAVSNTPDSPLAARADALVLTHAGEEKTVACKTYVATLAALTWAAAVVTGGDADRARQDLLQAAPAMAVYLERWREHVSSAAAEMDGVARLFLLGRGPSQATTGSGALITKESAHFHAEAMSAAAFRHGPVEMIGPAMYALVFAGDPPTAALNRNLAGDIREAGGKAAVVEEEAESPIWRMPRLPGSARLLLEILPVQMITLALSAMAGREAGKFDRTAKVTATE